MVGGSSAAGRRYGLARRSATPNVFEPKAGSRRSGARDPPGTFAVSEHVLDIVAGGASDSALRAEFVR